MGFVRELLDAMTEKDRWMRRAAGISTLRLICHEDTWTALKALRSGDLHQPEQGRIDATEERITRNGDGMLEIALSGPEVVRIIQVTHRNQKHGSPEDLAISGRAYTGFGSVLETVGVGHSPGVEIPPVILDDRPPAAAS